MWLAIVNHIRFSNCGVGREPGTRIPGALIICEYEKQGKNKMFGKIKKIFFTGVFGVLYVSFIAQLVYVLGWVVGIENKLIGLGLLTLEWLILIAARYLSKRSSNSAQHSNGYRRR